MPTAKKSSAYAESLVLAHRISEQTGDRRLKGNNSTEKKRQQLSRNESRTRYDVNWIFDLRFNRTFPFEFFVLFLRWDPGFLRSKRKFLLSGFELCGLHCTMKILYTLAAHISFFTDCHFSRYIELLLTMYTDIGTSTT